MAEITKFTASEIAYHVRHDLRQLPPGKTCGNEAVDPALTENNYSLLNRCETAEKANAYRKKIEKECFQYNRKNLVHAVEVVIQCPSDCPAEQKESFFRESYKYVCSTLPMGERCVIVAEVHADERHFSPAGEMISKDHLHVMYVPAVRDAKHEGYKYRLCADQLTKRARLKEFHPGLQKHLDEAGIKATVFSKKAGDGKAVALSVSQLKELTKITGQKYDRALTVDQLAEIINRNQDLVKSNGKLTKKIDELQEALSRANERIAELEKAKTQDKTWGDGSAWGTDKSWGNDKTW